MTSAPAGRSPRAALVAAAVGVATLIVFLPAMQNQFVNWDDDQNFLLNLNYRGLGAANLRWMFTTFHMGPYQPLSWLTLGLDYMVWGMRPAGYHLTNVVLHAANAGLLFLLILALIRRALASDVHAMGAAALGALMWAVHPLRAESVAWVTERRDVLSGFFLLLAVLAYVRRPAGPRPLVVLLAALALLAKASTMVLPGLLVILDVFPLRRLGGRVGWTSAAARRVMLEKLPFVAMSVAAGVLAIAGQRHAGALAPLASMSLGSRLGAALYQSGFYLWKTILPLGLQPLYELPADLGPFHPLALAGTATLLGLAVASWAQRERCPGFGAATAAYLMAFAPTSGLVQSGAQVAADRYTYLPALGWSVLIAGVVAGPASSRATRTALVSLATGATVLLALATVRQVGFWRDSVTLWERALARAPRSASAHDYLGRAYVDAGRRDDAVQLYQRWLRDEPGNGQAWGYYGVMLGAAGAGAEALPVLDKALALDATNPATRYARGLVRYGLGDIAGAIADYSEALRLDPQSGFTYYNRGLARRKAGELDGAIDDFAHALDSEAVRSTESAYAVYANYGVALADRGQVDAGLEALRMAVSLAPPDRRRGIEALLHQTEARRGAG